MAETQSSLPAYLYFDFALSQDVSVVRCVLVSVKQMQLLLKIILLKLITVNVPDVESVQRNVLQRLFFSPHRSDYSLDKM